MALSLVRQSRTNSTVNRRDVRNMTPFPLDVFVIQTPNSPRSTPLLTSMANDSRLRVTIVPAVIIRDEVDLVKHEIEVRKDAFCALTRRHMSYSEIGCAAAHNLARKLASELEFGGVILEDDARILDLSSFVNCVNNFSKEMQHSSAVLSLNYGLNIEFSNNRVHNFFKIRLLGYPPLAVAYALTKPAASSLLSSNSPINYVADWPESKVKFYCLNIPLVAHGDENTLSIIDPAGALKRVNRSILYKLQKLMLIDYFFKAQKKVSFTIYLKHQFIRPLCRWIDLLNLAFLSCIRR